MSVVDQIAAAPHRFSMFAALRALESALPDKPRVGEARRAAQVAVRLSQPPFLEFAPAEIAGFQVGDGNLPHLECYGFGVFGPNGPLPMHLTELAYERRRQHADPTLSDFINFFQHRMLELFYRAWAESDPATMHDRPDADAFALYAGSFVGLAPVASRGQLPAIGDHAVVGRAGLFGPQSRPAEALQKIIGGYFRLPVRVDSFTGEWLEIPASEHTRLGGSGEAAQLGVGATLGARSWQVQHSATLQLGPLDHAQFCDFLPGAPGRAALEELLGAFGGAEWHWHLTLLLREAAAHRLHLGEQANAVRPPELGWSTWLGEPAQREAMQVQIDLGTAGLAHPVSQPRQSARHPHRQESTAT